MIEQQITLCSNGRAVLSGYSGGLLLGYAHNTGVYRLRVVCSGEWDGTTVVAFWHLPGPAEPLTTLVADGAVEVPALVTVQGGSGTVTFEGSDGTRTVTSASVPYRVLSNSGTTDPTLPEPGTPAWQQFLQQVKRELLNAASGLSDEERGHILALFRHAVYDNGEMLPHYNALAALWSGSSLPDVPPTPSQPDPPNNGLPTPRYKLAAPKTFVPANKEWIDTGIKPFAAIDTGMNLTVYATFTGHMDLTTRLTYLAGGASVCAVLLLLPILAGNGRMSELILDSLTDYIENCRPGQAPVIENVAEPVKEKEPMLDQIVAGIRQSAAAGTKFSGLLSKDEEHILREVIREYMV